MKATLLSSLFLSERGKIYYEIVNVKRAIALLEKFTPRTQQLENALEALRAKDFELRQLAKDNKYIEGLVMARLSENKTRSDSLSRTQSKKASNPRTVKGIDPETRDKRNQEIKSAWEKKKTTDNAFYKRYGKKYNLSPSTIRKIVNP